MSFLSLLIIGCEEVPQETIQKEVVEEDTVVDVDNDGFLSDEDCDDGNPTLNQDDLDGDGCICREEWLGSDAVFDALDGDHDGKLYPEDVRAGLGAALAAVR